MRQFLLLTLLASSFLLTSCENEGCTEPNSWNFNPEASVDDGSCDLWRNQFLGIFEIEENCASNKYIYESQIFPGNFGTASVIITNFADFGVNINAEVQEDFIFIPNQAFSFDGKNIEIRDGLGAFDNGVINLNYEYILNGTIANCNMNYFRI